MVPLESTSPVPYSIGTKGSYYISPGGRRIILIIIKKGGADKVGMINGSISSELLHSNGISHPYSEKCMLEANLLVDNQDKR